MPQLMPEWEKKLKRMLDIAVSFVILIITLPISLITSAAIRIESKGGIFFLQDRCGINGKIFRIIKFRSMKKRCRKINWSGLVSER